MKTLNFTSLNSDFRKAYKAAEKVGKVSVIIEGVVDQTKSMYPILEITNKHVSYWDIKSQDNVINCQIIIEERKSNS
jgi:hypothetical protein